MSYWLIKIVLILALIGVTYFLLRPVKTDNSLALRRIFMLVALLTAVFAIIFPELFQQFARTIGVMNGTNLLVYLLVVTMFAQMASSYRRDLATQRRLTELSRQVALMSAQEPHVTSNPNYPGAEPRNRDSGPGEAEK